MRKLTWYELHVLIKNEVEIMHKEVILAGMEFNTNVIEARCEDILKYINEIPLEDE